jgi:addiction module HigA family antidote
MSSSSITTDPRDLPCHPGEILREEYMPDYALDASALASALGISAADLQQVLDERKPVTPELAVRLGRYFGTSAQYWMNIQVRRDLIEAERRAANDIDAIQPISAA